MQESIVFLVRVQCRRKESSRSLSHLRMSFLLYICQTTGNCQSSTRCCLNGMSPLQHAHFAKHLCLIGNKFIYKAVSSK